jgi:DNA ligase-associated metallophosphoesterase
MHLAVEVCSEQLLLSPERAVIWPVRSALIVADAHFGKDDVFRRAGIALPRGPAVDDLQRLSRLLEEYELERLIVLGDFLHAATRSGDAFLHAFALWRRAHSQLAIDVVAGTPDRRESRDKWSQAVRWHTQPLIEGPFVLAHEPRPHPDGYVLAGHIHPTVRLPDGRRSLRVPVFWQRADALELPSFGFFTGGADVARAPGERIYAAGPEGVIELRAQLPMR